MSFKVISSLLATVIGLAAAGPALADTTLQGYICDQRGSVNFVRPTTHDKRFAIDGIERIAELVDARAQGPVGIVYTFNPPVSLRFFSYDYKEANNSQAINGVKTRFCFQKSDGSDVRSVTVPSSAGRKGTLGGGWSDVSLDSRSFPNYVQNGNGFVSKIAFIFKDTTNAGANNISLGSATITPGGSGSGREITVDTLLTDIGNCDLKEPCTNPDGER